MQAIAIDTRSNNLLFEASRSFSPDKPFLSKLPLPSHVPSHTSLQTSSQILKPLNPIQTPSQESESSSFESSSTPSKCSYDEDDTENYFEDKQVVCNGTEANPEYSNRHVLHKVKEKSLKVDLKAAGFPPEVVMKADEIFAQMKSGLKRGVRRRQLMFFCVQSAYNSMRIPEDPNRLASQCGITTSEIAKAYSMCSPSKVGYKPPAIFWKPEDYIKMYFQKIADLDIISYNKCVLDEVKEICDEVMQNDRELRDEKPHSVAAAVVVFYLQMNNCVLDPKKYMEIFNKSATSISKIKTKVSLAYNR